MVVFRSPVQRRRTPGLSTSPMPRHGMDEDPDDIFNATPGPARVLNSAGPSESVGVASSVNRAGGSSHVKSSTAKSSNGNGILQQRLAQSLMMVADSPSSKLNAPDPFKPRNQLRRDPPTVLVASNVLDHHQNVDKQQSSIHVDPARDERRSEPPQATPSMAMDTLPIPSAKGKERERNFELAAKALFQTKKPERATHTRGRASMSAINEHGFSTPQASTSKQAVRAPASESGMRVSAPMRASASNISMASAPPGIHSASSPGGQGKIATPVHMLAKIGRLTARNAHLESKYGATAAELQSIYKVHQELQRQYELVCAERAAAFDRIEKFEVVAAECEELIENHERLQAANVDLEQQRQTDIIEIETTKEALSKLKWKERKLRNELNIRREEGIYKEFELQNEQLNPTIRDLKLERAHLQATIADLKESLSALRFEHKGQTRVLQAAREDVLWYESTAGSVQSEVKELRKQLKQAEMSAEKYKQEERTLATKLSNETNRREKTESDLAAKEKMVEDYKGKAESTSELRAMLEEKRLEVESLKDKMADLNTGLEERELKLSQKETSLRKSSQKAEEELSKAQKDIQRLEKKIKSVETERERLQSNWELHQRASRIFGDGPSQTVAEAGVGSSLPPFTERDGPVNGSRLAPSPLGKRKRKQEKDVLPSSESEELELDTRREKSISLPPPLPKKVSKSKKAGSAVPEPSASQASQRTKAKKPKSTAAQLSDDDDEEEQLSARPAKKAKPASKTKAKPAKPAAAPAESDESGSSELDAKKSVHQIKRNPRRTAIKSGVPAQFRRSLKPNAKPSKRTTKESDAHTDENSSSLSDDSDAPLVASSPKNTSKASAKTPANASSQSIRAASSKLRNVVNTDVVVKEEKKDKAVTKPAKSGSATASAGSAPTTKKKITLHKSASSAFNWGSGGAGGSLPQLSGGSSKLFDLPDVLSPVVRR